MPRTYRYISGDSHLEVPSRYWLPRLDAKYREDAPRLERLPDGTDAWFIKDEQVGQAQAFDLYGGKGRDVWEPIRQTYDTTPGTGPAEQRIKEQDIDGIDAEVLFPAQVAGMRMLRRVKDDDAYRAVVRAYNDWLAEDYCSVAPDRLIGVGIIPWTGVKDAIAEMENCKKKGLKIVVIGVFPSGKGRPSPADDEFWKASLDMQMPVAIHVEIDRNGDRGGAFYDYKRVPDELKSQVDSPLFGIVGQTSRFARAAGLNAMQLTLDHLFERFPALNVYLAENSIGWVPFFLRMADIRYGRHRWWVQRHLDWQPLADDKKPSQVVHEHFYWGFQEDPIGVELRRHLGVNRVIWGTDFPHQESEWPNSMGVVERNFAGVPEAEKMRMVAGNIIDFLHLDGVAVPAPLEERAQAAG
jgi:predicted TIM-barrel fold metal-dependent hydrolase